jgi:polyisoprenoid-binding protein YceI
MNVATTHSRNNTNTSTLSTSPNGLATRTQWQIDPDASRVEFTIRKRLFVVPLSVTGRFTDVQGTITLDEHDPITAEASITIAATSIDTKNARRDTHLRNADFFHVDTHPAITFRSRRVEQSDRAANRFKVVGDLTVRGVTREVTLDTLYVAPQDSGLNQRMKLTLTTALNRRDFGIQWNKLYVGVADRLTVNLVIEAEAAAAAASRTARRSPESAHSSSARSEAGAR